MTETFNWKGNEAAPVSDKLQQLEKEEQPDQRLAMQIPAGPDQAGNLFGSDITILREANEQLVLSALKTQGLTEANVLSAKNDALKELSKALADHEAQQTQSSEANAQLLVAAISAQSLQASAEQAQQRQSEFLVVLVHELRNPLAPIRTAAALLGYIGDEPEQLREVQILIERQVQRMTRLLDDLFDVSRVNLGKLRVELKLLDISVLLQEVVNIYVPRLHSSGQTLTFHRPPDAIFVNGDSGRLVQVLSNVLDNASKYTPRGDSIELLVQVQGTTLVLTCTDNGIGITAEALSNIFEPFVQEDAAVSFSGAGLGIGLAVVREIVEAHQGSVIARSAGSGKGSQFVITLPLAVHAPPPPPEITAAP